MPVNTQHSEYGKYSSKWKRCRDCSAGQDAVHSGGEAYLPKLKAQTDPDYKSYKIRTTFYNATWRTISGLEGMMLQKPPVVEVPDAMIELLEDVDSAGNPLQVFAQEVCEHALTVGRVGVLVDCPPLAKGATQADAIAQNVRPTLQLYTAENIINWRTGRIDNKTVLTLVVLHEVEDKKDDKDEYKVTAVDQWRVLDLLNNVYRQRLYERKDDADIQIGADIFPTINSSPINYIPFQFIGTDDASSEVDEPPLIDLVDLNLSHYRTSADYAHGCHFTALPTLFLAGFQSENNDPIYLGSERAIVTKNPDAKAEFIEFSGTGLKTLENKLQREEQLMAIVGARMLEAQKKAVEAADSASIRRKGEESMLSSISQTISLGMTQALRWLAQFAALPDDKVKFELNRDFYPARMAPAELSALVMAWQQGAISDVTLFENLRQGEIIAADTTLEEEQGAIQDKQDEQFARQLEQQATVDAAGLGNQAAAQ